MNLSETARALALVQAFDQRTVGEADVIAWQSLLPDAALEDVEAAVRQHYAAETARIMPAHVLRAVGAVEKARNASKWAPGQHGVPRDEAAPEVTSALRLSLSDLPAAVAELVARVRTELPEGSREALKPRTVAWEREHRAFRRSQDGEPNPHYRPQGGHECLIKDDRCLVKGHAHYLTDEERAQAYGWRVAGSLYDPMPYRDDPALDGWLKARGWDSIEEWEKRGEEG